MYADKFLHMSKRQAKALEKQWVNQTVCNNYKIIRLLDSGSFGGIFLAERESALHNQKQYAAKIENIYAAKTTLNKEANILFELKGQPGFPKLYYYKKDDKSSVMIISLLNKNLDQLHKLCGG